jgi:tetratricopeptide (TPR) repeat protein
LANFLNFSGLEAEHQALNLQAEGKGLAAQDFANAGWRAYQAVLVFARRSQSAETLACAERCTGHRDRALFAGGREKALAIRLRGLDHKIEKNYPVALEAYQEALAIWRTISPESDDVAIGLNSLAAVEGLQGDFAATERDYREALRLARKINDREGVVIYTGNLAELALDREDWPAAEALAREALPLGG